MFVCLVVEVVVEVVVVVVAVAVAVVVVVVVVVVVSLLLSWLLLSADRHVDVMFSFIDYGLCCLYSVLLYDLVCVF